MNSTVYINGHQLGTRPYGYSTFEYDLTPYINRKGDNVIAVKVDNSDQPNSRWYSGCGIYRHVWLTKTMKKAYIPQWGQYVSTTPQGDVRVKTDFAASGAVRSNQTVLIYRCNALIRAAPHNVQIIRIGRNHRRAQHQRFAGLQFRLQHGHLHVGDLLHVQRSHFHHILDGHILAGHAADAVDFHMPALI